MSTIESPLNKVESAVTAHRHAAWADAALSQGFWLKASKEHHLAAAAFLGCIEGTEDENTKRTLRLLHDEHTKKAYDLDRKVARLIENGKDPDLPQLPVPSASQTPPLNSKSELSVKDNTAPIEESFMLLGHRNELNSSFAQFWKILEGMLDHLSQPVAFATVPLHNLKNESNSAQRKEPREPHSSLDYPLHFTSSKPGISNNSGALDDLYGPTGGMDDSWEVDSDESFQMVGAESRLLAGSGSGSADVSPKEENDDLKRQLHQAHSRISELEILMKERLAHEHQLRDSIMQAQRAISSSQMLQSITKAPGLTASPLRIPQLLDQQHRQGPVSAIRQAESAGSDSAAALQSRVNELEERLRLLQIQDITQKAAIAKYKERWDKVKDSMKRKKVAKAAAEAERNRIEEEVEPE